MNTYVYLSIQRTRERDRVGAEINRHESHGFKVNQEYKKGGITNAES